MKINRFSKKWVHFILALALMGAAATAVRAESFSVEVPFAFEAAGKSFPAGVYTVDSVATGVLILRGANPPAAAALLVSPAAYSETGKTSLVFDRNSDVAMLSTINLNSGLTLTLSPSKKLIATTKLAKGPVVLSHP